MNRDEIMLPYVDAAMRSGSPEPQHWTDITPEEAKDIVLPREDIVGPINSMDEPCPWPWDPQQLRGAPLGQYHCPYCGDMQVAGMPHLDYRDEL